MLHESQKNTQSQATGAPNDTAVTSNTEPRAEPIHAESLHPGTPVFESDGEVKIGDYKLLVDEEGTILGCSCGAEHAGKIEVPKHKSHHHFGWFHKSKEGKEEGRTSPLPPTRVEAANMPTIPLI